MKKVIWNWAFCIVVCLASEANPQLGSYSSNYGYGPYYSKPLSLNLLPLINTCDSCECGAIPRMNRIVGGEHANQYEFPWLVKLDYNGTYCGGAIISPKHIITAAHCTEARLVQLFNIQFVDGTVRRGRTITKHYYFNKDTYNNDIAIIEMDEYVNFDKGVVKRVCLPTEGQDFSGTRAVAAGWGNTRQGVGGNRDLNKVILPIMSEAECDQFHYTKSWVTENMFCAGYLEGRQDTCHGDSGGPLIVRQNGRIVLAGIVSNGRGCARAGYPGLYTKVSKYVS